MGREFRRGDDEVLCGQWFDPWPKRYETFVDCPELLIDAFAAWLGADLEGRGGQAPMEGFGEWRERVVFETGLEANVKRSEALGRHFGRHGPDPGPDPSYEVIYTPLCAHLQI